MNVFQPFARPVWISVLAILPIRFLFLYTMGKWYPSKYLEGRSLVQLLVALPLKQTSKRPVRILIELLFNRTFLPIGVIQFDYVPTFSVLRVSQ